MACPASDFAPERSARVTPQAARAKTTTAAATIQPFLDLLGAGTSGAGEGGATTGGGALTGSSVATLWNICGLDKLSPNNPRIVAFDESR